VIRRLILVVLLAAGSLRASTTVTILHFSDYHAHALPFYTEAGERGGVARAIGFMERQKKTGALVFNGGDMMNRGAPAWSDRYRCTEWAWLNGIVDAMAFGNHDADYGNDELLRCRATIRYPILSANTTGFERSLVFERDGVRIGVFAISGPDFPALVTTARLTFSDPVSAARDVVQTLRGRDRADAVVMIGHETAEDDYRLAAAVPGIDLIFGTHAHLKRTLTKIPGTETWFISPYQYLEYISKVELVFDGHELAGVKGELVPVDASMKPDEEVAARVEKMQAELEADRRYSSLFKPVAKLPKPMSVDELWRLAVDTMRDATKADVALSTRNSFRQPLPAGTLNLDSLRAALPYDNEVVVAELSADDAKKLLSLAAEDTYVSGGIRDSGFGIGRTGGPNPESRMPIRVAVTDYMTSVAAAYRDVFSRAKLTKTGIHVRDAVMRRLGASWPAAP